jgi:hypothetical protein
MEGDVILRNRSVDIRGVQESPEWWPITSMTILYEARATAEGGRSVRSQIEDGTLSVDLAESSSRANVPW